MFNAFSLLLLVVAVGGYLKLFPVPGFNAGLAH
jgi:hypothetical protein